MKNPWTHSGNRKLSRRNVSKYSTRHCVNGKRKLDFQALPSHIPDTYSFTLFRWRSPFLNREIVASTQRSSIESFLTTCSVSMPRELRSGCVYWMWLCLIGFLCQLVSLGCISKFVWSDLWIGYFRLEGIPYFCWRNVRREVSSSRVWRRIDESIGRKGDSVQ